jgi:peptidoglycan/xylan/chitin deacetylase (PgdA/CDA1 family)
MRPFHKISILFIACALVGGAFYFLNDASWWWLVVLALVYVHLLVLGAVKIRWNFFLNSLHHYPAKHLEIALTFDDGPAAMTPEILDILKAHQVPAAFFSIGKNAAAHPEIVKRWDEEGHLIGNHSYQHGFNFDWKSARAMTEELEQTNAIIKDITGKTPQLFRPPYGVTNPNVAGAVRRTGMKSIGWNVRSFDTTAKDPKQLLNLILGKLQGGDIILLHDSMAITCEILTPLIGAARQKGFTFVRVDQLLEIEPYA